MGTEYAVRARLGSGLRLGVTVRFRVKVKEGSVMVQAFSQFRGDIKIRVTLGEIYRIVLCRHAGHDAEYGGADFRQL